MSNSGGLAAGVVNVITRSGGNDFHGSLFEYQRLEAMTAAASDGTPLADFHREQYGGSAGGHIIRDKLFYFGAAEGIDENLSRGQSEQGKRQSLRNTLRGSRTRLSAAISPTGISTPTAIVSARSLINFYKANFNEDEGQPVDHVIDNGAFFGCVDYNINERISFTHPITSTIPGTPTRPSMRRVTERQPTTLKVRLIFRHSTSTWSRR